MLNYKYLNTNIKIKKKVINVFIPMLFGFKNNKITKAFYYENMYYKIFYLIFNHVSLIEVFFKDKKIFYNFSKYFQINLYIFLIKKKLMILNLFFHFFYMLFLTFENLEEIYTNQLFFKGYKHRFKYKTFFKRWIKPDYGINFYFKQRINSISLYVLNFNIYKNFYFSKYNLFLIHTKLIYKLFYYFKMLQYKLQSFLLLYKPLFKFEKKMRLMFAKTNCIIYKNLNSKLINFFSLYKSYLKKTDKNKKNLILKSVFSRINLSKNTNLTKIINNKPIYNKTQIKVLRIKQKNTINSQILKYFNNISLAKDVFKYLFDINFTSIYFNVFYNSILKMNWLKQKFLNDKVYYKKIFNDFLMQFMLKYSLSTKLLRRYDIYQLHQNITYYKILEKFVLTLTNVLETFISHFFNLNNLSKKAKITFIDFIMKQMKFYLLLETIAKCEVTSLKDFYVVICNIMDQFLNKNFKSDQFHLDLNDNQQAKKTYFFARQFPFYDHLMITKDRYYRLFHRIEYKGFIHFCETRKTKFLHNLMRNKFSDCLFSLKDIALVPFDEIDYFDLYEAGNYSLFIDFFKPYFTHAFNIKYKIINKKKLSFKLIELIKQRIVKKKKMLLLQLLSKKLKKKMNKMKTIKLDKLNFSFLKQKKYNNFLARNIMSLNKNFSKKIFFFNILAKNKRFSSKFFLKKRKSKIKRLKLKIYKLKKKKINLKKKLTIQLKKKLKIKKKKKKALKSVQQVTNFQKKIFSLIKKKKIKQNSFFRYYNSKKTKFKRNKSFNKNFKNKKYNKRISNKKNKKFNKKFHKNRFKYSLSITNLRKKFYSLNPKMKQNLYIFFKYTQKNNYKNIYLLNKVKKNLVRQKKKIFFPKKFFLTKLFKRLLKRKFFINRRSKALFLRYLKKKHQLKFKFLKKKIKKKYIDSFFKRYKKFKERIKKINKKKRQKKKKTRKLKGKSKLVFNKKPLNQQKLLKLQYKVKSSNLTVSPFQLYSHNLQLLKKKINKLRNLKVLKKINKLKKLNRKKLLLNEISMNYLRTLHQTYINLKIKYLNLKNKLQLLKANSKNFDLLIIKQLTKKLTELKANLIKILKKFNKISNQFKFNFKLKIKILKPSYISKKTHFSKKPLLIKNKFFKSKSFDLNKKSLNRPLINLYSKRFKQTLAGKKFKTFLKSAYFKKLINFPKHYKKFLQIQKRINKKITFKINYFLLQKGFYAFCKLNKGKKIKAKFKSKNKLTNQQKKLIKLEKLKKKLLTNYANKLIEIDFKIFKILKQNDVLTKLNLSELNISTFKNENNLKLVKLYSIKSKINRLKKLKLDKLKIKKLKIKKLKIKKLKLSNNKLINLLKKKILLLTILIEERKKKHFQLKLDNNKKLINFNILKLRQLKLKLNKVKLKFIKLKLNKLKFYKLLLDKQKKRNKRIMLNNAKVIEEEVSKVTKKALNKLYLAHKLADAKLLQDDLREMQRVKDLKKKEDESFFKLTMDKNATTFDSGLSYKERQRRHLYRVQRYYKDRQKRLELDKKNRIKLKIPRTKKQMSCFSKQQKYMYQKVKKRKLFSLKKYTYFFILLLKTRLTLFKNKKRKNIFNFFFLNKLKNSIKNILFKNKTSYYNILKYSFDGMNIYNEYKLWHLHFKQVKKIPFKLIRLYSKFYFNKLLYNLKFKSNFFSFYKNYLQARTKVKYFNGKQSKKSFKKKKIKKLAQIMFHQLFKFHMKYFIASKNVIFSLMRNGSFYMYYKLYEISRHKTRKNATVSLFLTNLSKRRSFYVSKSTCYSNFFFIYWAKKFYGYNVYGNYKHLYDEFNILNYYFKFFKSKSFFFNYLINFIFSYIQKININIFNYVFILNQYKTKLIIESNQFYKYLILFHFKRNQYLNFFNLKETSHIIIPRYFSFFSLFFKELSVELSNWYSIVNNSCSNLYQSTFLFNLCFINHNTNAVYLHYKYKYLYYYRVYNFYIFYIFYYLYNHLFKVYKKLKLKEFKLSYDLIKYNEYNRYYLGLRTRMLILTIRNRYKRGFTVEKIFRNLKFFLRESMKKKELAGYYISIRGRYKRSSRSNKLIIKKGVYSFNKIDLKVDSSYGTLNTKYGIAGIKVIFAFK
jgi:hypothetical protein